MGKNNKEKIIEIKRYSFDLYNRVKFKEISVQDAYNKMNAELLKVDEFKGVGTKGRNKIGLKKEMERLDKMYKPKLNEWVEELKRLFPYTFKDEMKKLIDED